MNPTQEKAVDYWLENTERIYKEDLHVSTPVIEAFTAGYELAKKEKSVLAKIKQYWQGLAGIVVLICVAIIQSLLYRNKGLKDEAVQAKEGLAEAKTEVTEEKDDEKASNSVANYEQLRASWLKANPLAGEPTHLPPSDPKL